MRNCKHCGSEDCLKHSNDGAYRNVCRDCYNRNRRNIRRKEAETTKVYYLPEEHYVGKTKVILSRMNAHKRSGKIIEGYEVLATFERDVDAHFFETLLHQRGYNGYAV